MTNTLGNINISSYFKMPRQKPTINNVIEGFLIRKPTASDATDEDMKWGKVEILWIDNSGRVKRRFINYLSKFQLCKKVDIACGIGLDSKKVKTWSWFCNL